MDSENKNIKKTENESDGQILHNAGEATCNGSGVLTRIGNVSDNTISILASIAVFILLAVPAVMCFFALKIRQIDYTLPIHLNIIRVWAFPIVSVIVAIIYILVLLRIRNSRTGIKEIIKNNSVFVIFSLMMIFIVISQVYHGIEKVPSDFFVLSFGESFDVVITYFVFILFGSTQVRKESHKRMLIRTQLIISIFMVVVAFILWHGYEKSDFFTDWDDRFSGIFTNANYFAYYLSVSVPLSAAAFIYEKKILWKMVSMGSLIICTCGLSVNDSRGGTLATICAVGFIALAHYIIEKKINVQVLIVIPVFLVALFVPVHIWGSNYTDEDQRGNIGQELEKFFAGDETAGADRLKLWRQSVNIISEHMVLGIGFEGVLVDLNEEGVKYDIDGLRPHNEFLQYALFFGIPMAALYILGCLGFFIRALRKREIMDEATLACLAGAFGYLVGSFFGITIFSTAMYLFIFLGMGYVREVKNDTPVTD